MQHSHGAVGGARTRNLHLGKVVLSRLSYYRMEPRIGVEPILLAYEASVRPLGRGAGAVVRT